MSGVMKGGTTYPTRARIVDVTGEYLPGTDIGIATPFDSKPHVGKEGLAELVTGVFEDAPAYEAVRITLDDGTVLWGWECWWDSIDEASA